MPKNARGAPYNFRAFPSISGRGRAVSDYRARQIVYSQGDPADAVFHIVQGRIKLVVTSEEGKEAVVAVIGPGESFGEICLVAPLRLATAVCLAAAKVMRIEKADMIRALRAEPRFAESFAYQLLARMGRAEQDIAAHHFNSAEKRLARALLTLANGEARSTRDPCTIRIDQQTLADMVGTTRPRINFFMNKFRKLGMVEYGADVKVHAELLDDFLQH